LQLFLQQNVLPFQIIAVNDHPALDVDKSGTPYPDRFEFFPRFPIQLFHQLRHIEDDFLCPAFFFGGNGLSRKEFSIAVHDPALNIRSAQVDSRIIGHK